MISMHSMRLTGATARLVAKQRVCLNGRDLRMLWARHTTVLTRSLLPRDFSSTPPARSKFDDEPQRNVHSDLKQGTSVQHEKLKPTDTVAEPVKGKRPGIIGMFKEYGLPFLVWETAAWMGSFCVVYAGVSGYGGYETVIPALKQIGLDQYIALESVDPQYGNIFVAIAINEALEVARFPLVVATTRMC